ncbi:ATP-dependent DNA helicase PIF1 [Lasiodiplodia hormozganensis]|uniref:ATP-dependent DNA helicase n=1 Tax=Lasiodiplodia hormozganensis TaxID=869390 RepID=A0AA39YA54_9PEZI|nr:ATP-dependent DNA helicase PIF1 [Lasiodiplodia hormozganensis]
MIPAKLLDALDEIARKVRMDDRPFGGIQLILGGDFCQIPPELRDEYSGKPQFCFQAESWRKAMIHTVGLTEVFGEDPLFANMLRDIWQGVVSKKTSSRLKQLDRPIKSPDDDDGPEPVSLLFRRDKADRENTRRLDLIESTTHTYVAEEGGKVADSDTRAKLLSSCPAPGVLDLKKGAQVMLIKDLDYGLVSGSVGRVVDFADEQAFSQQWSGDEGKGNGAQKSRHHKKEKDRSQLYPVVRFFQKPAKSDGTTATRVVLCRPAQWTINEKAKLTTCIQVPLVLTYALAVEQTVGRTIEPVNLNLLQGWSENRRGIAYCALSRATGLKALRLRNFEATKIRAHPDVRAFYNGLNLPKGTISHRPPRVLIGESVPLEFFAAALLTAFIRFRVEALGITGG